MKRRQFLARAGAVAGGLSAGAGAFIARGASGADQADRADSNSGGAEDEVADPRRGVQEIIWSIATGTPTAALTFDDGPHPYLTPPILDVLDRYDVKATFMAMGYAAERHPDLIAEVVARGHEVGNHTWSHLHLPRVSAATTRREIERGTHVIEDLAGRPVKLFRPPQGRLSEDVVRLVTELHQDIVLWSVTRGRKRWHAPREVADYVAQETGPGDIVDLHDGIGRGTFVPGSDLADTLMERRQTEVEALPRMIEQLQDHGLELTTVSELRRTHNQGLTAT